jgi:hypothetical protein
VHQVGFSLNEYIEMQGQQNIKFTVLSEVSHGLQQSLKAYVGIIPILGHDRSIPKLGLQ